jgi:hypothetical protein
MPRRYPWPASALTPADMHLLHEARNTSPQPVHITELIASAVRAMYASAGNQPVLTVLPPTQQEAA